MYVPDPHTQGGPQQQIDRWTDRWTDCRDRRPFSPLIFSKIILAGGGRQVLPKVGRREEEAGQGEDEAPVTCLDTCPLYESQARPSGAGAALGELDQALMEFRSRSLMSWRQEHWCLVKFWPGWLYY